MLLSGVVVSIRMDDDRFVSVEDDDEEAQGLWML
jgi:hypothetical protein